MPELLDARARAGATDAASSCEWREANAEALPFGDGEFDAVMSCIGVMFAPHHQAAADELVRVCRAGGTIGLLSWTPEGFIGQLFAAMKPYVAAAAAGCVSRHRCGATRTTSARLLGDRVSDVDMPRARTDGHRFADGAEFRDYFKAVYGPTIAAYRAIADDPERVAALDADIAAAR